MVTFRHQEEVLAKDMATFATNRADIVARLRDHADRMERTTRRAEKAKLFTGTVGVGGALTALGGVICALTPIVAPIAAIIGVGGAVATVGSASTAGVQVVATAADCRYRAMMNEILKQDRELMQELASNFTSAFDLTTMAGSVLRDGYSVISTFLGLGALGVSLSSDELKKHAKTIRKIVKPACGDISEVLNLEDMEIVQQLSKLDIPGTDYVLKKAGGILADTGVLEIGADGAAEGLFEMALNGCAPASAFIAPYSTYKLIVKFCNYRQNEHAKAANTLREVAQRMEDAGKIIQEKQKELLLDIRRQRALSENSDHFSLIISGIVFAVLLVVIKRFFFS